MFMLHVWKKFISLLISSAAYHFSNPETRLNPALWSVLLHSCKAPLMSQGDCLEKAIYFVFPGWRHPNKIKLIPLRIVKHQLLHTQNQKQGLLFTGHRPAFKITELSVNTFSLFHLLEQTNNTSDILSMTVTYLNDPLFFVIISALHYFLLLENLIITLIQEQTAMTVDRAALSVLGCGIVCLSLMAQEC